MLRRAGRSRCTGHRTAGDGAAAEVAAALGLSDAKASSQTQLEPGPGAIGFRGLVVLYLDGRVSYSRRPRLIGCPSFPVLVDEALGLI